MLEHELVRRSVRARRRLDGLVKPEVPRKGGVAVYNDANIVVPTAVWTVLTFNTERWDDAAFHSVVANTSRLTVPAGYAGRYVITGHVAFASSGAGNERIVRITLGAAPTVLAVQTGYFSAAITTYMSIATIYDLSATDYVELWTYQDTGGNLNVLTAANYSPEFRMERVG